MCGTPKMYKRTRAGTRKASSQYSAQQGWDVLDSYTACANVVYEERERKRRKKQQEQRERMEPCESREPQSNMVIGSQNRLEFIMKAKYLWLQWAMRLF